MASFLFDLHDLARCSRTFTSALRRAFVLGAIGGGSLAISGGELRALNVPKGSAAAGSSSAAAATSQAATSATAAATQAAATNVLAMHAQAAYARSVAGLQAMQAAQAAARAAAGSSTAGNLGVGLPTVPQGLQTGGLVPILTDGSAPNPAGTSLAQTVTVTPNSNGTSSVTLSKNSAITIPASVSGSTTITASGTGIVGTITIGESILPLTGGVATSVPPGGTISITQPSETVTFASGSKGVPTSFSTYNYAGGMSSPGVPAPGVPNSWSGISGLTQSTYGTDGTTTVSITQTSQQAVLKWQTFNIGKNTTLDFDQSQGGSNVSQWVAINEVGNSIAPSQVLGSIEAPGQVYVIDQNGIIFGGSSQVNVGALTASALALNPAYINNGLLNNAGNNYQFQFSSLFTTSQQLVSVNGHNVLTTVTSPLWTAPTPDATGAIPAVSSVPTGDVTVQAGAQLTSLTNEQNQGGRIALIAPNVVNNGTISTPDGQTILAAGLQVGLTAHNANDASLRGLDVSVGQVSGVSTTLPTGTFLFNGLPSAFGPQATTTSTTTSLSNSEQLTFAGTTQDQVGSYTAPGSTTPVTLTGGINTIPLGSTVTLTSAAPTYAAVQAGTVTNAANVLSSEGAIVTPGGDIESSEASVILTGQTVNQLGIINGSTSVTLNGRIDLLADYNAAVGFNNVSALFPFKTGTVNLGGQSITQILPELSSTDTTIGTELPFSSLINIQGQSVEMFPGSLILAPGAQAPASTSSPALDLIGKQLTAGVTIDAGSWFKIGTQVGSAYSVFSNDTGTISLDANSTIDVSGSQDVAASVAEDIVAVQLRGPQLANSPLQRGGSLRNLTVYADIRDVGTYNGTDWIGTPIGDVSGYANDVLRTVGELTSAGGTVALTAGTSVNVAPTATINVSGGYINYLAATVPITRVLFDGELIDISQATPDQVYQGIDSAVSVTSSKWGVTESFTGSLNSTTANEPGFIQGGNGGGITITAPAVSMQGNLYGNTVAGTYQRTLQSTLNSTYAGASFLPTTLEISGIPQASRLNLSFLQATVDNTPSVYGTTSPNVEFQTDAFIGQNAAPANTILLSQDIVNNDGFGNLTIGTAASGSIVVPQGVLLTTSAGGSINFTAANIDIEGSIAASAGGLAFTALDVSPTADNQLATPAADPTRGQFTLGADASLSATGFAVDDRPTSSTSGAAPLATTGGSISLAALNVDLATGSTIDVSGGVAINSAGKISYGNAGKISILGGQDPQISSLISTGQLVLGATLTGYSGNVGGGGTLTIQSPLVQIGGATLLNGDSSTNPFVAGEAGVTSSGTTLWLDQAQGATTTTDFFSQGGFSNFTIEGLGRIETDSSGAYLFDGAGNPIVSPAVLVAANTKLHPIVEGGAANFNGSALSLGGLSATQAASLLPSQRSAVNLTLNAEGVISGFSNDGPPNAGGGVDVNSAGGGGLLVRGDLVLQAGSSIVTDPQTNSANGVSLLAANGLAAILGDVVAPAGTITVTGGSTSGVSANQLLFYNSATDQPFATVDIGPNAILSTAGTVEQTVNVNGYFTGSVLAGGHITIGGNIVAELGAVVDVSGASATLYETAAALGQNTGQIAGQALTPTVINSNGGSIALKGKQLLYSDATLLGAAGGANAQGGSLSVSTGYAVTSNPSVTPPSTQDINLIVSQQGLNGGFSLPANSGSGLGLLDGQPILGSTTALGATVNDAIGGQPVYSYFAVSSNLFVSSAPNQTLFNNGGKAGGFATLSLGGTLDFIGPVSIKISNALNLAMSSGNSSTGESGGVIYADSPVTFTAPYVELNSYVASLLPDTDDYSAAPALAGSGSVTVNASILADVGNLSLQDISTLTFNSSPATAGDIRGMGTLQVAGQVNLNAAQIYPPTEETFTVVADDVSITRPTSGALPSLPLSGGGTLDIFANTIEQDGVLRAPFGTINLGNGNTQNVTLSSHSITSVSGVDPTTGIGITVPYGIENASGTWYDPQGNDISLTGPPAKQVNVNGQNVTLQSGSTVDLTGGGSLFAYQFTSGTGGTNDILASTGSTFSSSSFAVVPGYSLAYSPDGLYNTLSSNLLTSGSEDAGYYNSNLAVGEQIYLNAGNGLAAGTYTLLPARYALLPGAFLVTPSSLAASANSTALPAGYTLTSGYITDALNPTFAPVRSSFEIFSQAAVLNTAPYTIESAATYFPATAVNNHVSVPRLPVDAGQLVLDATQAMSIEGTLLSGAGAGGLGGQVDIASPEDIEIVGPNANPNIPAGTLVLDSSQLTSFGASSLLIGGFRTTTDAGTSVTVTTSNLLVDNSGATTTVDGTSVQGLAAPDIILVSNGTLEVANGATIAQFGTLSGGAQALTLQGNGDLLRVSSDSTAASSRQNVVAGDTTSNLTIGDGARIINASGAAVGALTLDSTGLVQISTSVATPPVLSSQSLTIDSSLINLELSAPTTAPTTGLVITNDELNSLLNSAQSLSLLSYSSIALYGSGQIGSVTVASSGAKTYQVASLALHADDIYYADTVDAPTITINAQSVSLDNSAGGTALPSLTGLGMSNLTVNAQTILLGSGATRLDQFATVALNADSAVLVRGLGAQAAGSDATPVAAGFSTSGNLVLTTPLLTAAATADQAATATTTVGIDEAITAGGSIVLQAPTTGAAAAPTTGQLAASLSLTGSSITQNSGKVVLNSGSLSLQTTGGFRNSDVTIDGTLDVSGLSPVFYDLTKYTNGGEIALSSLNGDVTMGSAAVIDVSAASGPGNSDSGAGNGGVLSVKAAGVFTPATVRGAGSTVTQAGLVIAQGTGGTFSLDVGSLDLATVENGLNGFGTQTIRDRNDDTVIVGGTTTASNFSLSTDTGSIIVTGSINASGVTGGTISLNAGGSVTLQANSLLTVAASELNNAGEGGTVSLDAGAYEGTPSIPVSISGINLQAGSVIDLSVGTGSGGTLHLRAPQTEESGYVAGQAYTPVTVANGATPMDVAISAIPVGTVKNAGSVEVEGFFAQDAQQQGSATIDSFESSAEANASAFMANAGTIQGRLFASNPNAVEVLPGEEIDNSSGSLVLQSTWDLSSLRYGSAPGLLTLRAAGDIDIDFGASINDGFQPVNGLPLYQAALLPVGSQSWSYQLTSGADFGAANLGAVQTTAALQAAGVSGSLQMGYQNTTNPIIISKTSTDSLNVFYQTIRTGSGSITINSGGDVLLLNNLANIYTAGSQVDGTLGGTFTPPAGSSGGTAIPATYSSGGGNVTVSAQGNIAHETYVAHSTLLAADSSAELPTSWLDREGSVTAGIPTTWWVDFTNFFEGVGALGGGNVTLAAGGSVVNVDAVVPTNAREVNGQMVELGGGNVTVSAGNNIDAGVYYVENGQGSLTALNNIQTNATRAAVTIGSASSLIDWLPTTLFLGQGDFAISAGGNLLLGPVANPFLLPQSYNNIVSTRNVTSELSYFSTYAATDAVDASSLAGSTTIQDFSDSQGQGSLYAWYDNIMDAPVRAGRLGTEVAVAQPWLLLAEAATSTQAVNADFGPATILPTGAPSNDFGGPTALMPPTLRVTAFGGDINLIGRLTLSPSIDGTINLVAEGSINAFEQNVVTPLAGTFAYGSGLVNVSDADPSLLPSALAPLNSDSALPTVFDPFFTPTSATQDLTLQARQQFHADINGSSLHAGDSNPDPAYIYAGTGDISGLTLFSSVQTQVIAGQDITDVGLYLQNNNASNVSLVQAGRDIIAYDASTPLRQAAGINVLGYEPQGDPVGAQAGAPNSGDIQISGPGALEVLAGRDLTLGNDSGQNPNNSVPGIGLYTGLTSVGSEVNPALTFGGADLIAAAGIGNGYGLGNGNLDFKDAKHTGFIDTFLDPGSDPANPPSEAARYLPDLGKIMGLPSTDTTQQVWTAFNALDAKSQDAYALKVYYLVLRDAGSDHNNPASSTFGNYTEGYAAIAALFPTTTSTGAPINYAGNINVTSREIKTASGGDINLLTPGGGLVVGVDEGAGQVVDQGILTVDGGNISIFANNNVELGTSRIFTLNGGDITIWSTVGDIAAGASSKTVVSAPPTRVIVDPTSGSVETDLAGLATGGGIGALQTNKTAPLADITLIAPVGTVDAGDAGIRASGKLNIAAARVANASNISAGGGTTGVSTGGASINLGALTAASSAAGSSEAAAQNNTPSHQNVADNNQDIPSIITVEVLGYGGGDD
jgi:filamentous hemagglutinin